MGIPIYVSGSVFLFLIPLYVLSNAAFEKTQSHLAVLSGKGRTMFVRVVWAYLLQQSIHTHEHGPWGRGLGCWAGETKGTGELRSTSKVCYAKRAYFPTFFHVISWHDRCED